MNSGMSQTLLRIDSITLFKSFHFFPEANKDAEAAPMPGPSVSSSAASGPADDSDDSSQKFFFPFFQSILSPEYFFLICISGLFFFIFVCSI